MIRFEVWLVRLDPTEGAEMRKTRPCVVVSRTDLNLQLATVLVAPLTTAKHTYSSRVPCCLAGRAGEVALDQMRCVDKRRLLRRVGRLQAAEAQTVLERLAAMFAEELTRSIERRS